MPGFVIKVKPSDVGSRVSLRLAVDDRLYTDVVGELLSWADGLLRVRRRDGSIADVREDRLVAGKVVPPPPDPPAVRRGARLSIAHAILDLELEEIASRGWLAFESEWLGRWLLRASEGFTGRANSVLPLGDPGLPLDSALERVLGWYRQRGLTGRFQVPLPAWADLDSVLDARGWTTRDRTQVLTASMPAVLAAPYRSDLPALIIEHRPSAEWLAAYHYRGGPLPAAAPRQLVRADRVVFASVRIDDAVVAIARGALARGWIGITAVEVAPPARGKGLARHLIRELCAWAGSTGDDPAHSVYLQVHGENAAARAVYDRLGFRHHHDYQYRIAPDVPASRG